MELVESLNRTLKLALDQGKAASVVEAEALFRSFHVQIVVDAEVAENRALQAALLTLLNAAPRTFHGEVTVTGELDFKFLIGWHRGEPLCAVVATYGARCSTVARDRLSVLLGCRDRGELTHPFAIHLACSRTGFTLSPEPVNLSETTASPVAGVAGAGAALNECFQFLYFGRVWAGQRVVEFDLPSLEMPARDVRSLWAIGLGHLGQAVFWTMATCWDFKTPTPVLKLQDYDRISKSSLSTGLLTRIDDVGSLKVDVVAREMSKMGFGCEPVPELLYLGGGLRASTEACVVTVDNLNFRRQLDKLYGARIFEAGIGDGPSGFTKCQFHVLPGQRAAADIWAEGDPRASKPVQISAPAYQKILGETGDECGTTQLAGRSVATPFVGAFAGAVLFSALMSGSAGGEDSIGIDVNAL